MTELAIFAAFMVGLLGGVHCAGMCGGIVSAISWRHARPGLHPKSIRAPAAYHLAYSGGRIGSYVVAGAVAGGVGSGVLLFDQLLPVRTTLYVIASALLLAQGLYLLGLWRGVVFLERAGGRLWRRVQPWTRRILPIDSAAKALALGALWGWLPCGMVYSVLGIALASGDPLSGGLLMLAFGLGTLPNLVAMGVLAEHAQPFFKHPRFRQAAGALVLTFGIIGLVRAMQPAHDSSFGHAADSKSSVDHVRASH